MHRMCSNAVVGRVTRRKQPQTNATLGLDVSMLHGLVPHACRQDEAWMRQSRLTFTTCMATSERRPVDTHIIHMLAAGAKSGAKPGRQEQAIEAAQAECVAVAAIT